MNAVRKCEHFMHAHLVWTWINNFISLFLSFHPFLFGCKVECEEEEIVLPMRYYPESLSSLSKASRFSEDEIKRMCKYLWVSCEGKSAFVRQVLPTVGKSCWKVREDCWKVGKIKLTSPWFYVACRKKVGGKFEYNSPKFGILHVFTSNYRFRSSNLNQLSKMFFALTSFLFLSSFSQLLVTKFETTFANNCQWLTKQADFPSMYYFLFTFAASLFQSKSFLSPLTDRSFKGQCPTGFISEETFKDIYSQFFPFGGSYHNSN